MSTDWTTQEIIDGLLDHPGVAFTAEGAALIARLQAVLDAARVVALTYCSENPGCNCCMCRLHQSLRALDGEVKP
jgi:hypothetical protein